MKPKGWVVQAGDALTELDPRKRFWEVTPPVTVNSAHLTGPQIRGTYGTNHPGLVYSSWFRSFNPFFHGSHWMIPCRLTQTSGHDPRSVLSEEFRYTFSARGSWIFKSRILWIQQKHSPNNVTKVRSSYSSFFATQEQNLPRFVFKSLWKKKLLLFDFQKIIFVGVSPLILVTFHGRQP